MAAPPSSLFLTVGSTYDAAVQYVFSKSKFPLLNQMLSLETRSWEPFAL